MRYLYLRRQRLNSLLNQFHLRTKLTIITRQLKERQHKPENLLKALIKQSLNQIFRKNNRKLRQNTIIKKQICLSKPWDILLSRISVPLIKLALDQREVSKRSRCKLILPNNYKKWAMRWKWTLLIYKGARVFTANRRIFLCSSQENLHEKWSSVPTTTPYQSKATEEQMIMDQVWVLS